MFCLIVGHRVRLVTKVQSVGVSLRQIPALICFLKLGYLAADAAFTSNKTRKPT